MRSIIRQFKRMYHDDGRNDKNFDLQEQRLKYSLDNLKIATEALIKAAQNLHDVLTARKIIRLR